MKYDRILVWFRNDLRLGDNETLTRAIQQGKEIIPVYCFDSRQFKSTSLGFAKTGAFRAQFLLESVADLRQSFQKIEGNLVIWFTKAILNARCTAEIREEDIEKLREIM